VTILIAIFVHYAPNKMGECLLLTFQNRSLIRKVFRKFSLHSAGP